MNHSRINSLDKINIKDWNWNAFLEIIINQFSSLSLDSYPIDPKFLDNRVNLGSDLKPLPVQTSTWACKAQKIRQARVACVEAKGIASVLNFLIVPEPNFELPFFGADFVTLTTGHLLALDLQPALKSDSQHTKEVWNYLLPLYEKWNKLLPSGGPLPKEAESYFSPGLLWTRIPLGDEGNQLINNVIQPAFQEYLSLFWALMIKARKVSKERSLLISSGQKNYMNYRAYKDPARGLLQKFYGVEWTENYIHKVLFNLDI